MNGSWDMKEGQFKLDTFVLLPMMNYNKSLLLLWICMCVIGWKCENWAEEGCKAILFPSCDDLLEFPPRYGPVTAMIQARASLKSYDMIMRTKVKVDKLY